MLNPSTMKLHLDRILILTNRNIACSSWPAILISSLNLHSFPTFHVKAQWRSPNRKLTGTVSSFSTGSSLMIHSNTFFHFISLSLHTTMGFNHIINHLSTYSTTTRPMNLSNLPAPWWNPLSIESIQLGALTGFRSANLCHDSPCEHPHQTQSTWVSKESMWIPVSRSWF